MTGLKASIELDDDDDNSEIPNSFLEVVQIGLDDDDDDDDKLEEVDCWGLFKLGEAKIEDDPANAANPPDEFVF